MTTDEKRRDVSVQLRITWRQMKKAAFMLSDIDDWRAMEHANELNDTAKMVWRWAKEVLKP